MLQVAWSVEASSVVLRVFGVMFVDPNLESLEWRMAYI